MERLEVVEQVLSCTRCELHRSCTAPVAFRGPAPAPVAVIGEAPGQQEDRQGRPFVGPAGQLLTELLTDAGFDPEAIAYINSVSCFPSGTPTAEHVTACDVNKWAQVQLVDPTYLLLTGRVALQAMRPDLDIRRGRGRPFLHQRRVCFAVYHPAAALRNHSYESSLRDDLVTFKALTDAGSARWTRFVVDTCAGCPVEACWYEDSGIAWCPVHLTGPEAARYRAREQLVADELAQARARRQRLTAPTAEQPTFSFP